MNIQTAYDRLVTQLSGFSSALGSVKAYINNAATVLGTAPIVSSGGTPSTISIVAATSVVPGSMSAADKAKLDGNPSWRILENSDRVLTTSVSLDLGPYTLVAGEVPLALVYVTDAAAGESYAEGGTPGTFTGTWWQRPNGVANQFLLRLFQGSGSNRTFRLRLWAIKV